MIVKIYKLLNGIKIKIKIIVLDIKYYRNKIIILLKVIEIKSLIKCMEEI